MVNLNVLHTGSPASHFVVLFIKAALGVIQSVHLDIAAFDSAPGQPSKTKRSVLDQSHVKKKKSNIKISRLL